MGYHCVLIFLHRIAWHLRYRAKRVTMLDVAIRMIFHHFSSTIIDERVMKKFFESISDLFFDFLERKASCPSINAHRTYAEFFQDVRTHTNEYLKYN